ncbi:MAG: hypothetical protein ACKVU4_06750 [Phycisphaerales bacterium]
MPSLRTPAVAALFALAAPLAVPTPAHAQLLDLRSAPAPVAGDGAAAAALAEQLTRDAERFSADRGDAVGRARAAWRRAAARLLADGESAGPAGSPRVLLGWTLARRANALDSLWTTAAVPPPGPEAALMAHDLDAAVESGAFARDAERVLRDVFAATLGPTADAAPPPHGWVEADPATEAAPDQTPGAFTHRMDAWATIDGITPEAIAALRDLDATLRIADGWTAYTRTADHTRGLILAASGVFAPRPWVDADARRVLAGHFGHAAQALGDPATRDTTGLDRLAALASLMQRADRLEFVSPAGGAGVRAARAAVVQVAAAPPSPGDERARFDACARGMELVLARAAQPEDTALLRQVRPAYRTLLASLRQDEVHLLGALPDMLRRPDALTEPGIVAVLGRVQRTLDDLHALAALSAGLAAPTAPAPPDREAREPSVAPERERLASRVLTLGQAMAKPDTRDSARADLRAFAERFARSVSIPGEEALNAAIAAGGPDRGVWSEVTGVQELTLSTEIADRRGFWLEAWEHADADAQADQGARLDNLCRLLELQLDAARVLRVIRDARADGAAGVDPPGYSPLQAWPGWELSIEALAVLAADLPARLGRLTTQALGPDPAKTAADVETVRAQFAAALLCGRLMPLAEARALGRIVDRATLFELATGGPRDAAPGPSWLAQIRAELADVSRYAEEIGPAEQTGAKDRAAKLRAYVNARALAALEHVERAER